MGAIETALRAARHTDHGSDNLWNPNWDITNDKPQRGSANGRLIVYTCKVPAIMEGFKKVRVVFFKTND